jgi:hypothetical protein
VKPEIEKPHQSEKRKENREKKDQQQIYEIAEVTSK